MNGGVKKSKCKKITASMCARALVFVLTDCPIIQVKKTTDDITNLISSAICLAPAQVYLEYLTQSQGPTLYLNSLFYLFCQIKHKSLKEDLIVIKQIKTELQVINFKHCF